MKVRERGVGKFRRGAWETVVVAVGAAIRTSPRSGYEGSRPSQRGPAGIEVTSAGGVPLRGRSSIRRAPRRVRSSIHRVPRRS